MQILNDLTYILPFKRFHDTEMTEVTKPVDVPEQNDYNNSLLWRGTSMFTSGSQNNI